MIQVCVCHLDNMPFWFRLIIRILYYIVQTSSKSYLKLTSLTQLNLNGTGISDNGLEYIKLLTNLTRLDLSGTKISDGRLKELADKLKICRIYH
ncbi:hypothetical protein [Candidatus Uabimicrobium sp. HlEnr_7]|uniref:hypothetical protein n=1 Tax=Candidatus Uabimicrobium helgolandensis TaxID=3095367 RepID=UPI00355676EC